MMSNPRVLGVVRLSRLTDDTTSPERQRAEIQHWADRPSIGGVVVGWSEDLDVSGGLDPFKRPSLGPWLTNRVDDFDVIAVYRLDRLSRRSMHFSQLLAWAEEHGKIIVSITEGIDMSTPSGKMVAQLTAVFAEGELDLIRSRAAAGARTRLEKGVWVGGVEPFGYLFQKIADGNGKRLVQEPEYAALLRDIVKKINSSSSPYKIAVDLNTRGVLTWRDRLRELRGEQTRGTAWTSDAVLAILKNPTLGGLYTYKGQIVEDLEGNPVKITDEPILPHGEWLEIATRINERKAQKPARAAVSRTMLGGVAVCAACGARMSSARKAKPGKTVYHYYTCNALQTGRCATPARVRRDDLDAAVSRFVDEVLGSRPVMEKRPDQSAEFRAQLSDAEGRLTRLGDDYLRGKYDGEVGEAEYWRMNGLLSAKVATLRKVVAEQHGGPEYVSTGKSYRELWEEKDDDQRREFLQRHGIAVSVSPLEERKGATVMFNMPDIPGIGKAEGLGDMPTSALTQQTFKVDVIPQRKRGQG